ncbi:UDP-4-amino-4,6-dideoxy-N-acetyl-beta-L-altrosamine transaminase [Chlorobaculum limnaeum]|uniref:UDP-4-amino-4, 6-dideoxy-N-acetyl-beta-L-altrosamine transaminase n=1 Tax=Chlorobaculum limnaeum TaxID=274537 RepID=A0A1D8D4J5_CHLLM|nr:DegT/DnrJ/EryC1/StrS family aminotransferase [Chlorobaculum limnaeum]AOS82758.1 UDP-4-amino-4,6-dideoxy-N-acetyl-beta-L-altrosamine transaminase [Chlorobaculum limnaeum]
MINYLPFALPDIGEEEISEVVDSMRSGWLTTGPKTKQFEEDFATFVGDGVDAIAVNSATSGLHLALEAIGIGNDDEVIVPVYTFTATAEVVRYLGAEPVFVDIDPETFNIDPIKIEASITPKTKAIIPVHFAGCSCDMEEIINIARKHSIKVIEDAAHALPTTSNGKLIGSLQSDVTVFSFYATKTITTGEGGMIVTRNPEIARRCRVMRLHGISRDAFDRYTSTKPSWHYEVIAPGFKYNMTDLAASLGIHQLKKVQMFQEKRESMAKRYNEAFCNLPVKLPSKARSGDLHAWHLYVIRLADSVNVTRDRFIELVAERGIGCSVHFIPLHLHPYWKNRYRLEPEDFPLAYTAYQQAVSLPIYTRMSNEDQEKVIDAVREILS